MKDEFTVKVFDNETGGDWRDISELSGGEKVIVQEALMCAIAHLCERALADADSHAVARRDRRRARSRERASGTSRCCGRCASSAASITSSSSPITPAASALADAQIRVGGGTARIVLPPFDVQEAA
jgi:hypothetical protein